LVAKKNNKEKSKRSFLSHEQKEFFLEHETLEKLPCSKAKFSQASDFYVVLLFKEEAFHVCPG
jgi:hypothetical protein